MYHLPYYFVQDSKIYKYSDNCNQIIYPFRYPAWSGDPFVFYKEITCREKKIRKYLSVESNRFCANGLLQCQTPKLCKLLKSANTRECSFMIYCIIWIH
jgi:hypothetical protein